MKITPNAVILQTWHGMKAAEQHCTHSKKRIPLERGTRSVHRWLLICTQCHRPHVTCAQVVRYFTEGKVLCHALP